MAHLDGLPPIGDLRLIQVSKRRCHQEEAHKELDALMPGMADEAFKGEP
jgi:hypothetical protein